MLNWFGEQIQYWPALFDEMWAVSLFIRKYFCQLIVLLPSFSYSHVSIVASHWGFVIQHYYSFKIFPHFWLVKTTHIIHHNQLLFTKFGKNLCHIESMTSKVQPAADYWTDDVKMTSKVQRAALIIEPLTEKTWGRDYHIIPYGSLVLNMIPRKTMQNVTISCINKDWWCCWCYFWWSEKQRAKWRNSFKN